MSDLRERIMDDDREVLIDDEDVLDASPALDPMESVDDQVDRIGISMRAPVGGIRL